MKFLKRLLVLILIILLSGTIGYMWISDKYVVPIMMYHNVMEASESRGDLISPENFKKHMDFLERNGFHVLSLRELVDGTRRGRHFPWKSVVITMDDGYENNYTNAYPVLKEKHFPITLFVAPGCTERMGFLSWKQIREMHDHGIGFGSHGMEQGYLPDLNLEERAKEVVLSKRILEEQLQETIDFYAYPVGGFDPEAKDLLQKTGYKAAFTTNRGSDRYNRDLYELKRIKFSNKDNSDIILWAKLSGYYNLFRQFKRPH